MATETARHESPLEAIDRASAEATDFELALLRCVRSLASLKFTVALFGMAIFIVLAGTLAQHRKDIWEVVDQYFRVPLWPNLGFAWIEFQDFLAPAFFAPSKPPQIPGGFLFPGGWLIGGLMSINLLAAHGLRFKPQASGSRLWAGLGVIAAGMLVTLLVIASGSNKTGVQESIWSDWTYLWILMQVGLGAGVLASLAGFGWLIVRGKSEWWLLALAAHVPAILGGLFFYTIVGGKHAEMDPASMRILWQLMKGAFAGLVLLSGCFMVFKKRAGVVLLHAGVGLMMLSEVLVGTKAVEAQLWMREGEAVNFVRDVRKLELAFVDRTDPDNVEAIVIPESYLRADSKISHDELPVNVEVVAYLRNSEMRRLLPRDKRIATAGAGTELFADEARAGTGTDTGGEIDKTSAYVRLTSKDGQTDYGTYLVSIWFDNPLFLGFLRNQLGFRGQVPQQVEVDGHTYEISLRFKRTYKPYTMKLDDIRKQDYVGTNTPRDYSSFVKLTDPGRKVDRDVRIWMNNPLRFGGETFYQSNYLRDPWTGREATVLAVVTNTGWMIPYVACMIVLTGMLAHFLVVLVRFLNRRQKEQAAGPIFNAELPPHSTTPDSPQFKLARKVQKSQRAKAAKAKREKAESSTAPLADPDPATDAAGVFRWLVPLLLVLVCAVWIAGQVRTPAESNGKPNFYRFGSIPVTSDGRVKPYDTLARNTLRVISGKQTFQGRMTQPELELAWDDIIAAVREQWDTLSENDLEKVRYDVDGLIDVISEQTDDSGNDVEAFVEEHTSGRQPAVRWLLDVISGSEDADEHRVFRIDNLDVIDTLNLPRRKGFRYSFGEIQPRLPEFFKQAKLAGDTKAEDQSLFQRKILDLQTKLNLFHTLRVSHELPPGSDRQTLLKAAHLIEAYRSESELSHSPMCIPSPESELKWEALKKAAARVWVQEYARREQTATTDECIRRIMADIRAERSLDDQIAMRMIGFAAEIIRTSNPQLSDEELRRRATARIEELPPDIRSTLVQRVTNEIESTLESNLHIALAGVLGKAALRDAPDPLTVHMENMLRAHRDGDVDAFNREVDEYANLVVAAAPEGLDVARNNFEAWFNHFAPFFSSIWLYFAAFVFAALAWLGWNRPLNNASSWLIVFTLLLHTFALVSRIYISGRPPVTNLYSSAVFIGWGCVILGLVVEAIFRIGIGNIVSAVAGFATLWIAHLLAGEGDTFTVLQAVLDTQFWLATHVTCVTLGYATTFVSGLLGLLYVLRGFFTPSLSPKIGRDLYRMIYGTLCFAIFFSFVGTVLGGLWADDSWGRFWGWDPKENGALIIVLWNALVLHARWDGMVKERGLAVLVIGGNVVTAWSWFGVNELGIGLHSYGFTEGVLMTLGLFVLSQLAAIAVGCLPKELWWSFRQRRPASGSLDA